MITELKALNNILENIIIKGINNKKSYFTRG